MAPGSTAALILGLASGRLQPEASILLGPGLGARSARGWRPGPGVLASQKTVAGQPLGRASARPVQEKLSRAWPAWYSTSSNSSCSVHWAEPEPQVAFISALTVFPKGRDGLAGENAELQRRGVVCPGHTAGRRPRQPGGFQNLFSSRTLLRLLGLIHTPYRKNQGQTTVQGSDIPSGSVPALPASLPLPFLRSPLRSARPSCGALPRVAASH